MQAVPQDKAKIRKAIWSAFLKVAIYGLGHQAVIIKTAADAASKNLPGLAQDAATIAATFTQKP